jgi:uncharacterized protein with PIN domain
MNIETARKSVGRLVMSYDPGSKMIHRVVEAHGPYKLLQITKGGEAILEGREDYRVPPTLIRMMTVTERAKAVMNTFRYPPAKNPIISSKNCPECSGPLKRTGWQKCMAPPLDVMQCERCELEYWRRTA